MSAIKKSLIKIVVVGLILFFASHAKALDYELTDLDGKLHSLDQYKGKWLVVNYWATWCKTCIKEMPDLIALYEKNKDKDIAVIGINFEQINIDRLKAFVDKKAIPFPVLRGAMLPDTPLGRVNALPTTFILDPSGKPVASQTGIVSRLKLEKYLFKKRMEYKTAPVSAETETAR